MRIELKEETSTVDGTWYYVFRGWVCVKASRNYQEAKAFYDRLKAEVKNCVVLEFFEA